MTELAREAISGLQQLIKRVKSLEANQFYPIGFAFGTVSNPPTSGEITALFDSPTNIGSTFLGLIVDSVNSTNWIVGTEGTTWYVFSEYP